MEEQNFDNSKLHEYLTQHLDQFPKGDEELKIFKFSAGTSNPTFLLRKSGKEFVLRQKSPVTIYCGFHKVDVEYKIMSYLGTTEFPVPKMYLFCEDTSIMGQEFYVMEYIKGRQFPDANLPGVPADETKAIFHAAIKTLVQLQKENLEGLHLQGAGDRDNYFKYRLEMFEEGYKRVEKKELPNAHRLMKWLKENVPKDLKKAVIHHTDFRISNMILHPEQPEILAVLDWEGASWGHPLEDLAYFVFPFHFPAELECLPIKVGYYADGIPSEETLLSQYCDLTGQSLPLPNWTFFMGLSFFRVLLNMQTVLSLFSGGGAEFPAPIQAIASMLEPFVEHACRFVGLS